MARARTSMATGAVVRAGCPCCVFSKELTRKRQTPTDGGMLTLWGARKREDNPKHLCQHQRSSLKVVLV